MLYQYAVGQAYNITWTNPIGTYVYIELQTEGDQDFLLLSNGSCFNACGGLPYCSADAKASQIAWTPTRDQEMYKYLAISWSSGPADVQCALQPSDTWGPFKIVSFPDVNTTGAAFPSTEVRLHTFVVPAWWSKAYVSHSP